MVSYMRGRDVADALLATEAVSEDCEAVMSEILTYRSLPQVGKAVSDNTIRIGRIQFPLRMPIEFKPIDKSQPIR